MVSMACWGVLEMGKWRAPMSPQGVDQCFAWVLGDIGVRAGMLML